VAEKLIAAAGIVLKRKLDSANELQRLRNLRAAENYPELGPVGGAEDNPLP
jgi:hypothetical protein